MCTDVIIIYHPKLKLLCFIVATVLVCIKLVTLLQTCIAAAIKRHLKNWLLLKFMSTCVLLDLTNDQYGRLGILYQWLHVAWTSVLMQVVINTQCHVNFGCDRSIKVLCTITLQQIWFEDLDTESYNHSHWLWYDHATSYSRKWHLDGSVHQ